MSGYIIIFYGELSAIVFIGKSLYKRAVVLDLRHRKYSILFPFGSANEAKMYYESFNFESEKLVLQRIRIAFCKHRDEQNLDVGSKICHYLYCPDCHRANYINNETDMQREERRKKMDNLIQVERIKELEEEIMLKKEKLKKLKSKS